MDAGLALGAQLEALSRPVEGDQEQLVPPEPESAVEAPAQIEADPDATAVGFALIVTVTVGALVEAAVCARDGERGSSDAGLALGAQLEALSRPVEGDQGAARAAGAGKRSKRPRRWRRIPTRRRWVSL